MSVKSKTALGTDVDTILASGSDIRASEHRAIDHDIIDSYEDFIGSYTTAQIASLASPTLRQIVFDTDLNDYFFYDGTNWTPFRMHKPGAGTGSLVDTRYTGAASSADYGSAYGYDAKNSGNQGQANGYAANNSGENGQAIGAGSINSADQSQALGYAAKCRITGSTNISGAIIARKDDGESDAYQHWSTAEIVILTEEESLKATGVLTITLPSGVKMFVNEVGTIMTQADTVSGQATVSFGKTGSNAFLLAATATTGLTAVGKRDKQTSILQAEGVTSLVAEITAGATGTTAMGRFYFKGFIVEDE